MPRVLKRREQLLLYIIFGLILSSLILNFLTYPLWRSYQKLTNEITRTELKLVKYLEVLNKKDELEKKYPESLSALMAMEQKQDAPVAVLAELELLSQKTNVKILDIRPQGSATSSKTQEFSFDLRLEGNMESYLKFIYEIENSVFLLRIKKIMLRAKTDSASIEGTLTITQASRN